MVEVECGGVVFVEVVWTQCDTICRLDEVVRWKKWCKKARGGDN